MSQSCVSVHSLEAEGLRGRRFKGGRGELTRRDGAFGGRIIFCDGRVGERTHPVVGHRADVAGVNDVGGQRQATTAARTFAEGFVDGNRRNELPWIGVAQRVGGPFDVTVINPVAMTHNHRLELPCQI